MNNRTDSPEGRIKAAILAALPGAHVEVRDTTGGGDHFAAVVVSDAFTGKAPLERHRMVYAALGELMKSAVHALQLETSTPGENKRP